MSNDQENIVSGWCITSNGTDKIKGKILGGSYSTKQETTKPTDELMNEFSGYDKDVRTLTYKVLLEKFNDKYNFLNDEQKDVLKEYINSVDNTDKLAELYSTKVGEIKTKLNSLNKKTNNKVTKIKIDEVISLLKPLPKQRRIKDSNLIDLMQYYDLIDELEKTNG